MSSSLVEDAHDGTEVVDVCVVGFGPTGAVLANLLGHCGLCVMGTNDNIPCRDLVLLRAALPFQRTCRMCALLIN